MNNQNTSFWKRNLVPIIILIVCLAAAVIVYPLLPEKIPMQWNAAGVSRYGSRWEVFIIAALPAVIYFSIRAKYGKKR